MIKLSPPKLKLWAIAAALAIVSACSQEQPVAPQVTDTPPRAEITAPPSSEESEKFGEGEAMAEQLCAGCHAIGRTGESLHPDAPLFRELSKAYPIRSLQEALAEGIVVGHPDMPVFQFEPHQIDSLLTYIESVQPGDGGR